MSVNMGLRLGDYAVTPLYNIKAVVQATSISPSTLRAWERRYNIARPQRSDSGYRIYSERDVAIIRWLKAQVDAGMSISQAVSWLGNLISEAGDAEQTILPTAGSGGPLYDPPGAPPGTQREQVRDLDVLQQELLHALANYDEDVAEQVIAEAFSLYPVEQVGDKLFLPVLLEIFERRQRNEFSITASHFANNYLIQRLGTLLRSVPNSTSGSLIWIGSARGDMHEMMHEVSALLLSIYLRRSGYHVLYLGQSLKPDESAIKDLINETKHHQPAMLLLCASTTQDADKLKQLTAHLVHAGNMPAIVAYSGPIYGRNPELRTATAGFYVGLHAKEVVQRIAELLAGNHLADKKHGKNKTDKKTGRNKPAPNTIGTTSP